MRLKEKRNYTEKHLAGLRKLADLPMGTGTAAELWRSRIAFSVSFYEKLARQLACSTGVLG